MNKIIKIISFSLLLLGLNAVLHIQAQQSDESVLSHSPDASPQAGSSEGRSSKENSSKENSSKDSSSQEQTLQTSETESSQKTALSDGQKEPQKIAQTKDNESEETPPQTLEELKQAIEQVMQDKNVPAVGIAMLKDSQPVWVDSLGLANIEEQVSADENSLFRIGSTSKMFVALAVLQLVEQGKLSLQNKVRDLIPEIAFENPWAETNPILVAHLLEHTTGWDDIHLVEYANNDPTPITLKQGLDFHPHSRVSRWVPGTRSSYCNSGPPVAAYIVEKITGERFEDYIQTQFFDPLGMNSATYFYDEKVEKNGVTLYNEVNHPQDYWHIIMRPSGSINASPLDMSKFLRFFLQRGQASETQIVTEQSLARMESVETTNAAIVGQKAGYGLNNYSSIHEGWVYREHNGGVNGGLTELAYLPDANLGHVIMINSGNGTAFREISKLVRAFETKDLNPKKLPERIPLSEAHKELVGYYQPINSRQQLSYFIDRVANVYKLELLGDRLKVASLLGGQTAEYVPLTEQLFRTTKNGISRLAITTDPLAGEVIHIGNAVFKPVSSFVVYSQFTIALLWFFSLISSVLFFIVWGIRKLDGKIPSGGATRIRIWPLLASISVIAFAIFFIAGSSDPFKLLGQPSVYSIGILLSSIIFALMALVGVHSAIKERHTEMNRVAYWYCSLSSVLHFAVAIYLLWFGVIGLITWH